MIDHNFIVIAPETIISEVKQSHENPSSNMGLGNSLNTGKLSKEAINKNI